MIEEPRPTEGVLLKYIHHFVDSLLRKDHVILGVSKRHHPDAGKSILVLCKDLFGDRSGGVSGEFFSPAQLEGGGATCD